MGQLDGKTIIVTGASRGLGEAMAIGYAREGAALVLAARTVSDLERVATACKEAGAAGVSVIPTDVTQEAEVSALVERTIAEHGKIDVFVANVGTSYFLLTDKRYTELPTFDLDIVEQLYRINVIGTWLCMKAAFPVMKEGSSFIVVGSETGRVLRPGSGFYALTKAAQESLAMLAANETKDKGIRVNVLSPGGMVDTQLFGRDGMPDRLKQMHPPLPADIMVDPAVFLASDASRDVNGIFLSGRDVQTRGIDTVIAEKTAQ